MDMSTTYGGGGVTTRTSPLPTSDPLMNTLRMFLTDRINRLRGLPTRTGGGGLGAAAPSESPAPQSRPMLGSDPSAGMGGQAAEMDARRKIMDDIAAGQPAPMSYLPSRPGLEGGYTMDPRAMNADQRKMFEPQSSQMGPLPKDEGSDSWLPTYDTVTGPDGRPTQKLRMVDAYSNEGRRISGNGGSSF